MKWLLLFFLSFTATANTSYTVGGYKTHSKRILINCASTSCQFKEKEMLEVIPKDEEQKFVIQFIKLKKDKSQMIALIITQPPAGKAALPKKGTPIQLRRSPSIY